MRLRTGHKPSDWSENQPANGYHRSMGSGGYVLGGEIVQGESPDARAKRLEREWHKSKAAKK